jgi:hypothetical protein
MAPEPPAIAPISLFLSVGFISTPVAPVVFADFEIKIRQVCQDGNDNAHQYTDSVPLLGL